MAVEGGTCPCGTASQTVKATSRGPAPDKLIKTNNSDKTSVDETSAAPNRKPRHTTDTPPGLPVARMERCKKENPNRARQLLRCLSFCDVADRTEKEFVGC